MKKTLFLIIAIIYCSCSNSTKKSPIDKDSAKATTNVESEVNTHSSISLDKNKILGIWTNGTDDNSTFKINKDSIYYTDEFKSYKYLLMKDSIKIFYDDLTYSAKIHFVKDTLMMDSKDDGISKYWKFKD
jgi:hypothetical protein